MIPWRKLFACAALGLSLVACKEDERAAVMLPHEIDAAATGHFCNMNLRDHPGPKGQLFLKGQTEPVWFSSVRDTFAFTLLPEEPKEIAAIYVSDMGRAASWDNPGPGAWVEARQAFFVVGSQREAAMGGAEVVPFSSAKAANTFAREFGGRVLRFAEVPASAVLDSGVEPAPPAAHEDHHAQEDHHG